MTPATSCHPFPDTVRCPVLSVLLATCDSSVCPLSWLKKTIRQSFIHQGCGAYVNESMSVLTDPATHGILNSELTNCPRTVAVFGELAAHWQQMMGTLQRGRVITVPGQRHREHRQDTDRCDCKPTTTEGRRTTLPEELVIGGFAREVTAWLGYVDPKHEAGKLIQRTTKGSLRATEP